MVESRKQIEVVAAIIIDAAGRVFATQRGYGEWKDWREFPGGKMEAGETAEQALRREIREELDAEIEVGELLRTINFDYPIFHLTMHCFMYRLRAKTAAQKEQGAKTAIAAVVSLHFLSTKPPSGLHRLSFTLCVGCRQMNR